jgi:hypothetical protein
VCCGNFASSLTQPQQQLIVACVSGILYLVDASLQSFDVFAVVGYAVTQVVALSISNSELDLVLCIGLFSSLQVFQDRKVMFSV